MRVTRVSAALGVLVDDVDVRQASTDEWDALRRMLFETDHLLVLRGPELDDAEHLEAVRHFGPVADEGFGTPALVKFVSNHRADGALGSMAASWHIDYGFFPHPYQAISLYGLEIPPGGTETRFVNAVLAASDLPDGLRARVTGLHARQVADVSSPVGEAGVRVRLGRLDETYPHAVRPVLWPHRVTGEEILGVWEQQTDAILPLDPEESSALIEELFAHLYREDHVYVHRWQPGDLVVWDNHAVQHSRPDVGVEHRRTLRRVSVGETQDLTLFARRAAAR